MLTFKVLYYNFLIESNKVLLDTITLKKQLNFSLL